METIFDILKEYNDLDTTIKKENFINGGLKNRWNEISFEVAVEDLNSTCICACPVKGTTDKLEQVIFINYHNNSWIKFNKYPINNKDVDAKIRKLNRSEIFKGDAIFDSFYPVISLSLIRIKE